MDIEDSKYESLVSAKAEGESKVAELTATVAERDRKIETLEADKVKAEEQVQSWKQKAEAAEESQRVAAMKEERLTKLGSGFVAKLDKLETTAGRVRTQAGQFSDEEWEARLVELEETLAVKRDAKLDDKGGDKDKDANKGKDGKDTTAGLLFSRDAVERSGVGSTTEVTAASGQEPSVAGRQSVMSGLIRPRQKTKA